MQIEVVPIDSVSLDPANVRKHGERNLETIKASLRRFGQQKPIVVDGDGIIRAGNGTWTAAKSLGWSDIRIVRTPLKGAEAVAYAIADNRTAELAEWDVADLGTQWLGLDDELKFASGFNEDEMQSLLREIEPQADIQEDDAPEADTVPTRCKAGDLWRLGEHRLLCGDSTKAEDVARVMGGDKADLCFTSPPYGQQRDYTEEGKEKVSDWDGLMRGVFANLPMADAGQVLVNLGMIHRDGEWIPYWDGWIEWMRQQGWRRFGWYVWDQGFGLPGDWNGRFAPSHEFIFHFNKNSVKPDKWVDKKPENIKSRTKGASTMRGKDGECKEFSSPEASAQTTKIPDSVVRINRMHGGHDIDHPAIFPVEFPAMAMRCWPGKVFEPFCGSGTTLIAAEQLGRKCYGIEISPKYCDVIIARWEKLTGKTAEKVEG